MHIIELRAENVKRLKAVNIKPDGGPLVVIGGMNGQGKTSVLDSIMYALGGGRSIPEKPVREGTAEASIVLDLGEIIVTRHFGDDGKTSVKVQNRDGANFPSPQAMLDSLVGKLSFDPLSFIRLDAKKQVEQLKQVAGLDFGALDTERNAHYSKRTHVAGEVKRLKALCDGFGDCGPAIEKETSVSELLVKHKDAIRAEDSHVASLERVAERERAVEHLRKQLAEAEESLRGWKAVVEKYSPPPESSEAIKIRIDRAEADNARYRKQQELVALRQQYEAARASHSQLDDRIAAIDKQKADALQSAKFPVAGLSFTDDGLTFNGKPFNQASQAEQLKVAVGMGAALNAKARIILMRDGSLLDDNSLADVAEIAREHDMQVWIERVGKGKEVTVLIEDGAVVPMEAAATVG